LIVAAAFVALEMVVSSRYGFHRDELYFLACARHLGWGYVDQPPLVPAVAWLTVHVLGTSPVALRALPALAGGGAVVVTGLMARELGGDRKAQLLAALAAATSPELLAAFHLLSTAAFDFFFWSVLTFVLLRILRTGNDRLWVVLGVVAGVGLMNKFSVAFLLAAVAAGLLLTGRRRELASPWLWAGAGLALIIWLPDIVWNAQHNWAAVSMLRSLHQENGGLGATLEFVPAQLIVVGPVLVVLWVAGLLRLLASPFARSLGVAYLILLVGFALSGAKPYYLGGLYYALFAAGGVWAEERLNRAHPARGVTGWMIPIAMGCLVALPLSLPVLPQSALATGSWEGSINKELSATVGWPDFVGQLARVSDTLPARERSSLVIFTGDYGAAGAVDLWGPAYGLPHAISGHNNYWWWGPAGAHDGATTIAVNLSQGYLRSIFREVTPAGTVTTPGGVWSEERGDPIYICRGQKVSWQAAWPAARHYG
jgi:4-amino-4-deoxy-L-arabinose transferase-like glycosyltransferase